MSKDDMWDEVKAKRVGDIDDRYVKKTNLDEILDSLWNAHQMLEVVVAKKNRRNHNAS